MNLQRFSRPAALLVLLAALAGISAGARADEALPSKVLRRIKAATVFVRVQAGRVGASGTGFVFKVEGKTAYIATNEHVVVPPAAVPAAPGKEASPAPRVAQRTEPPVVAVVFGSGTGEERLVRAEVLAVDKASDLAVLKVSGVERLPEPLVFEGVPAPEETMTVYMIGYPFGSTLALPRTNPAVTIGKGTVTALRLDARKELTLIQIEAEVHPGNSGGPVVDTQGRLVGITRAKVRDTRIGLVIPASRLGQLLNGRPVHIDMNLLRRGKRLDLAVNLRLFDPYRRVRSATLHFVPLGSLEGKAPRAGRLLSDLPGGKKVALRLADQVGRAALAAPRAEDGALTLAYQVTWTDTRGDTYTTPLLTRRLLLPGMRDVAPEGLPRALGPRELRELLTELRSEEPAEAAGAARRLAGVRPDAARRKEVVAALRPLLDNPAASVREGAVRALSVWGDQGTGLALARKVDDENPSVRAAALVALSRYRGPRAAAAVARRLKSETDRSLAVRVLRVIGRAAEKPMLKLLDERNERVVVAACEVLQEVGTAGSVRRLQELEKGTRSPRVRKAARAARTAILLRQ
jgi:hypothetical protein